MCIYIYYTVYICIYTIYRWYVFIISTLEEGDSFSWSSLNIHHSIDWRFSSQSLRNKKHQGIKDAEFLSACFQTMGKNTMANGVHYSIVRQHGYRGCRGCITIGKFHSALFSYIYIYIYLKYIYIYPFSNTTFDSRSSMVLGHGYDMLAQKHVQQKLDHVIPLRNHSWHS